MQPVFVVTLQDVFGLIAFGLILFISLLGWGINTYQNFKQRRKNRGIRNR